MVAQAPPSTLPTSAFTTVGGTTVTATYRAGPTTEATVPPRTYPPSVRLDLGTAPAASRKWIAYRSRPTTGDWVYVRPGGAVQTPAAGGGTIIDAELPYGPTAYTYRVVAWRTDGTDPGTGYVYREAVVAAPTAPTGAWVIDTADASRSCPVTVVTFGDRTQDLDGAAFDVINRQDPVAGWSKRNTARGQLGLTVDTDADHTRLLAVTAAGTPVLLNQPCRPGVVPTYMIVLSVRDRPRAHPGDQPWSVDYGYLALSAPPPPSTPPALVTLGT